ncbi:hypothetical protein ASZ78_015428 [Callipepla squamata]|uniref:GRIP domain-containing protein n=1 Tax=Callipepla squamata TaxID=9009 RepID=A0A226MJC3_CALSU|nr:hypothetical protein ASZ78_015428 [Callipepla squamata]
MEVQDGGQEMVASPATPGSGKSKLDTLPKEDLIKFAKKQMMLIQKVKSRCTELEREIEELRSKPAAGGADDIIQALTERLDVVLLEKAESQQQCVALKKENLQRKQEAEAAAAKMEELQKQLEQSNTDSLEEIKALKSELVNTQSKYNEDLTKLKIELEEQMKKQTELVEQIECHRDDQEEVKRLQDHVQKITSTYEEQILSLNKKLETVNDDKNKEIATLQETIKSNSQSYHHEISSLSEELKQLKVAHQEEVSELMHHIEISSKENEEKQNQINQLQHSLAEADLIKEKNGKDETYGHIDQSEHGFEQLKKVLNKNTEDKIDVIDIQEPRVEAKMEEKIRHLERRLGDLQSQHSILKDELTYMSNVKLKLEEEIHRIKDEYFHEREDLDFKINELQLIKEDYCCVIEKLKLELQAARHHWETLAEEHKLETQNLREQHEREISELNKTLLSSSEEEKMALVFEMQELKEQLEKLTQEKEDAVLSYDSLRETLETIQTELGESAGKISQQFESMKQQQASDVSELQQKLRAAFNEKDVLLETVNRLQAETQKLSSNQLEMEELKHKIVSLQEENDTVTNCIHQKEASIKELEEKIIVLTDQNKDILNEVKCSREEREALQERCKQEQGKVQELQREVDAVNQCNSDLRKKLEELTERLNDALTGKNENTEMLEQLENQIDSLVRERENLSSEASALREENKKIVQEKDELRKELEKITYEKDGWLVLKEQSENLEKKLQMMTAEKDHREIERLEEENATQYAEHRSLIQDFGREKDLLKEELEEVLSEKDALQRDIQELKNAGEKTMIENQDLLSKIEEMSEKLAFYESQIQEQQKESKAQEDLNFLLEQKETELRTVKDELSSLKTQALREELEVVQSEKDQLSASMKDVIQGAESYKNLLMEYDKQGEELDSEKGRANSLERQIDDLTRQLQVSSQQQDQLHSANEDLLARVETLQCNSKLLEVQILELQKFKAKAEKDLEAEKLLKEQKIKEHGGALRELEELQMQLQKEKKYLQKVMQELELAKKDAQKSTLMDMEIADYEKLVKELNQKIADKDSRIEDLEQETGIQKQKQETLQEEIKSLQSTMQQDEERNAKIKQLLVKTKKELSDSKQAIQVAALTSEKHKVQEHLRTSSEQHQRTLSAYQQKIATLREECRAAQAEQASVTSEFESYKVRVHNVLKQQKNKSASRTESEGAKQEREQLETVIEQLKIKLQDTQHNLQMNAAEFQALQSEHDTLLERHNKMLQETVAKEAELREKFCTIQSENMVMKTEHAQALSQLTAQNEALRNNFRDQLLKSEIRRLERNQEREKSVANLEYLKNVLLQFIFLKSGSEKERLLPVIDTMLQLSPEEKGKLVAIAQVEALRIDARSFNITSLGAEMYLDSRTESQHAQSVKAVTEQ